MALSLDVEWPTGWTAELQETELSSLSKSERSLSTSSDDTNHDDWALITEPGEDATDNGMVLGEQWWREWYDRAHNEMPVMPKEFKRPFQCDRFARGDARSVAPWWVFANSTTTSDDGPDVTTERQVQPEAGEICNVGKNGQPR